MIVTIVSVVVSVTVKPGIAPAPSCCLSALQRVVKKCAPIYHTAFLGV